MNFSFTKSLFIFLVFAVSMPVFAQKSSFSLVPKGQKGESRRFELTKGKQVFRGDKQSIENESRQILTMTVLETTPKGSIISARYENTFGSPEPIDVRYGIGQNGDFQGITNMREVQQSFYHIFDNLTAVAAANPSVSKSVGEMRQFMTSDSYLTNSVFQELVLIHQFYNNTYTVDSLEKYETALLNLFNPTGAPIRAHATLLAKREGVFAYIRHTVEPDLAVIKQQAKHYMNVMTGSSPSKLSVNTQAVSPINEAVLNDYLFDEDFCSFNMITGWISAFQRKRTIIESDVKTVELVFLKEMR